MQRTATPTRADAVLADLRRDILNGRIGPGSKLAFADLSERYAASTGVLREVLPRLVEQGLATSEPQLGFRVVSVSVEQLMELTEARVAIETLAARAAVTHADVSWELSVLDAHDRLASVAMIDDLGRFAPEWLAAHETFHLAVLGGCRNRFILDAATRLRSISEVYRCWTRDAGERADRDLGSEHRSIMEAAVERDASMLAALIERHVRRTTQLLLAAGPPPPEMVRIRNS